MSQTIQMVDLKSQYSKIKPEIDSAISTVIEKSDFIKGEQVKNFESNLENYLNAKHVITCGNGTDALQIALMALGLEPEDEVITTSFTFIATAEVIALLNLKPVFVDVDPCTFLMKTNDLEKVITSKTKVIIPVHLFGQCVNMEEVKKVAKKYNLYVVEDTAQALGADFTYANGLKLKAGTIGDIGTTSFFPSKNLGCFGDGGALITNDDELAEKINILSNHGMKIRYYHDEIGVNSRLDTIQAAVLNVKLKYLDQYNLARQKAAEYYDLKFGSVDNLTIPCKSQFSTHIYHQYTLIMESEENDKIVRYLRDVNMPCMIYYPVPIHLQKAYQKFGYKNGDLPVTEALSKRVFSIPMHTELSCEQQDHIIKQVLNYFTK